MQPHALEQHALIQRQCSSSHSRSRSLHQCSGGAAAALVSQKRQPPRQVRVLPKSVQQQEWSRSGWLLSIAQDSRLPSGGFLVLDYLLAAFLSTSCNKQFVNGLAGLGPRAQARQC